MSAYLYRNSEGYPVRIHSYSAGSDFKFCARKYKLSKLDGWRERESRASTKFGDCIEQSIQFYHSNGYAMSHFVSLWDVYKFDASLTYTDKEGSWADLLHMGRDMMTLYEIKAPGFDFKNPRFQLNYRKEVFPKTTLSGIDFSAYVDLQCTYKDKPIILDIKTSSVSLPDTSSLLQLDPQLRTYAWASGIPNVGFLWFVKGKQSFRKGDTATLLHDVEKLSAGTEVELEGTDQKQRTASIADGTINVSFDFITKVKLQFLTTTIHPDDIKETGESIGQEIKRIVEANSKNFFPQDGAGIRFPANHCTMCPMLPICSRNESETKEKLYQVNEPEKDWLDRLTE